LALYRASIDLFIVSKEPTEKVLLDADNKGWSTCPWVIDAKGYPGALIRYQLTVAGQSLIAEVQNQGRRAQHDPGARVMVFWHPETTEVLPAE
jgi:putative spermidine/putrescine transport system ATP-binding protein